MSIESQASLGKCGILSFFENLRTVSSVECKEMPKNESTIDISHPSEPKDDESSCTLGQKDVEEKQLPESNPVVIEVPKTVNNTTNSITENEAMKQNDTTEEFAPTEQSHEGLCIEEDVTGQGRKRKPTNDIVTRRSKRKKAVLVENDLTKEDREKKRQEEKERREQRKQEEKKEREQRRREEKELRERKKREEREQRERKKREEKEERERKKRIEREERERQKQEEKKTKEEDKRMKEEEKMRKEEEKRKKDEAKERSQSRIGSFFKRANVTSSKTEIKDDYKGFFLPFYVKSDVTMANNWLLPKEELTQKENLIDSKLKKGDTLESRQWLDSCKRVHGYEITTIAQQVLQSMTLKKKEEDLQELLSMVPHKFIKFYENIRPPYVGTYSKKMILPKDNPFSTDGTGFDYGYDSDLDWLNDEGDEGEVEDLENEEDDEEEEQDEDDFEKEMDGFVDKDENRDPNDMKRKVIGPLVPIVRVRDELSSLDEDAEKYFTMVSVECLNDKLTFPIDPLAIPHKTVPIEENSQVTVLSPQPEKKIILITETQDILTMLQQVHNSTFSLGTLTEIIKKNLPQYKKDTIKRSIKEYAVKSLKGDRKWELKDADLLDRLADRVSSI